MKNWGKNPVLSYHAFTGTSTFYKTLSLTFLHPVPLTATMAYLCCCFAQCASARVALGCISSSWELIFLWLRITFLPSPTSCHRLCVEVEPVKQFLANSAVTNGWPQRKWRDDVLKYGLCVQTSFISEHSVPSFPPEIFMLHVECEGLKYSFQMTVD